MCRKIVDYIQDKTLKPKQLQRIRGYLNYYLSFAGNYFSIVNRILKLKNKKPFFKIFSYLICKKSIFLAKQHWPEEKIFFTDATQYQIAFTDNQKHIGIKESLNWDIKVNELEAVLFCLKYCLNNFCKISIKLFTDNLAVLYFVNEGTARWYQAQNFSIFRHFRALRIVSDSQDRFNLRAFYVPSATNPADALSRASMELFQGSARVIGS